jgi:nucleoside-diphosphate-sugar epimerase
VLTPVAEVPKMLHVCVDGLVQMMVHFTPRRVVFASSSSVYGDTKLSGASPTWKEVKPVSIYGMSKATGELLVRQWAAETGGTGVALRIGNVIGPGGKGLITHLVRHALTYPDGSVEMHMRGGGRIIRDYVPVEYAVRILRRAGSIAIPAGTLETYNVGAGEPLTNGHVAQVVKDWLAQRGYRLNIVFSDDPGHGEAWSVTLKTGTTRRRFKIHPPSVQDVESSIVESASDIFDRLMAAQPRDPVIA